MGEAKTISGYPLEWPAGWRRFKPSQRINDQFGKRDGYMKKSLTVAQAVQRVYDELRRMGYDDYCIIISSNIKPTLSGLPRSGQREPEDPGVAVYWRHPHETIHKVMAIDRFDTVAGNLAAIAGSLDSLRRIERYGGAAILDRAFSGFQALPSPNDWRHIFGFEETPTFAQVRERYTKLAKQRHPDSGGNHAAMAELNRAMEEAERELQFS